MHRIRIMNNKGFRPLGFTIIELLLAAAILSMVALAILSTFGAGLRAFDRVQSFGGLHADVLLFLEGFERDVRNAFEFSPIKFKGDSQAMSFASVGTNLDEEGGEFIVLAKKSYYFDDSQKALVGEEKDYVQTASAIIRSQRIGSIKAVQFQYYFYRKETQDGEEKSEYGWQETWADEEAIPKGVKIQLTFEDGGKEVSLARTVFIPSGGQAGGDDEEEEEPGDGPGGQGDV